MKTTQRIILLVCLAGANLELGGVLASEASAAATNVACNGVRLNFRGARLEEVVNYLAEAAGFTVVLQAKPKGAVDIWSEQPLEKEEALNLMDSVLGMNGFTALRSGRTLTIVRRDEAKVHDLPVKLGSDPAAIPRTDEVVTQILPVRFVEVGQLIRDLQPLLSERAVMTANESANALVITDTQANIHRVAKIIKAADQGAETFTAVRIFRLKNADPTEMADLLSELFPDPSQSNNGQVPVQLGGDMPPPPGMGGFPGPGGPGGGALTGAGEETGQGGASGRLKKGAKVTAVADPRTASLVVSAPTELMSQIEGVVAQLDANAARKQRVAIYQLKSAQPQDALRVLQALFQATGTSTGGNSSQTDVLETRRATQAQQQISTGSTLGSGGTSGGGLGSGGAGGGGPGGGGPSQ